MNIFQFRDRVIDDYADYVRSFIAIRDPAIRTYVDDRLAAGDLWPAPRIALNPSFAAGAWIDGLVETGILHSECARIFRKKPDDHAFGERLRLHRHQVEAVEAARARANYVLTTGTGSGKSLAYIIPIVDRVLREGPRRGIRAIVVYPMNALANSQGEELKKFLHHGYPDGRGPVRFERYTGQEDAAARERIVADPPDILLTNYVMLELMLTRTGIDRELVRSARGLRFLVFDELHTYRGRQGADVALLARRTRDACEADELQLVGTSATMSTEGSFTDQRRRVAEVASLLFGAPVAPEYVIGETLRRATAPVDESDPTFVVELRTRLQSNALPPTTHDAFVRDPLSRWIESTFGVRPDADGRLIRAIPQAVRGEGGAGEHLARLTGLDQAVCERAIEAQLLAGQLPHPETGAPIFAFRLHQFVSRGDTVYATVEPPALRDIRLDKQEFVPGSDRTRRLFPLRFCRACGQEYYYVRKSDAAIEGIPELNPEEAEEDECDGYLFYDAHDEDVWPTAELDQLERLPDDWKERRATGEVVKSPKRDKLPVRIHILPDGSLGPGGAPGWFVPAPFPFCLRCGVFYDPRARSDFRKLGTLGSEGRSTATTTLSLAVIRHLHAEERLFAEARKLLCFTDNRQDASLQAGHLNDFVEFTLVRSALYRAVLATGTRGLDHDELTQRVDEALGLEPQDFAFEPEARFGRRQEARSALRDVLGYALYRDLRRGWRLTSPNLEQCGLLRIEYRSLDEICAAEDLWRGLTPPLAGARPETRLRICKTLLDAMRRNLAIRVNYLERDFHERLKQRSEQFLKPPWALDPEERLEVAAIALPRASTRGDSEFGLYLSPRGGFGRFLRRPSAFPEHPGRRLTLEETEILIRELIGVLRGELLAEVLAYRRGETGFQVMASALRWHAGPGERVDFDPVEVPEPPVETVAPNRFFVELYRQGTSRRVEAREHTAQVDRLDRIERERRFRAGELPVLYCSPTMELGVDISDLNVVGLRNVPPTPANYAQRSGRAGRSGQAALVFTYCSAGSPHDQYFFRHPERMVSGQVAPPRIDLANHDLVRAHLHAVWLAEASVDLGRSLLEIIDVDAADELRFTTPVRAALDDQGARRRARERAHRILTPLDRDLGLDEQWGQGWLDRAFDSLEQSFRQASRRWLDLYRAARAQREEQHRIAGDHSRSPEEVRIARHLRGEAENQLKLLAADEDQGEQSDFNSYRYLASEGFLPGYSFPRLPLSAFLPARRRGRKEDVLSRPRFLAISEFGPQNFIYHEGARFKVERVIFPVPDTAAAGDSPIPTSSAKLCAACGYLHPLHDPVGPDRCEHCQAQLEPAIRSLLKMQNVVARRIERITSDEEERRRMGYELRSAIRFATVEGRSNQRTALVTRDGETLARLVFGATATLWRTNLGWRKRRAGGASLPGFWIDAERGRWISESRALAEGPDPERPVGRRERVLPYVEDRKNSLLIEPVIPTSDEDERMAWMVSLQAALKSALQIEFQLEDNELGAELLPERERARVLLIYEAAEGGAGVLRRLVDDPLVLGQVGRRAIELCHVDPHTRAEVATVRGRPPCESACYDCLMSYGNQPDHARLDRRLILPMLEALAGAAVASSPASGHRSDHLERLERLTSSELERRFLRFLDERGYRLPTHAGVLVPEAGTRPDFLYREGDVCVAVYIDGPHHEFSERAERDRRQEESLENLGYTVLRFRHDAEWEAMVARYPSVFGRGR